ncbi:alpha/beta fold hydrolase [Streptomyces sp. NPDC050560]|uniref:alpha/beta fold hydrolase n=1 Tax=Streptomyces sp. NPDC050560 TaxID=3365630 RepID=UPI00378B4EAB
MTTLPSRPRGMSPRGTHTARRRALWGTALATAAALTCTAGAEAGTGARPDPVPAGPPGAASAIDWAPCDEDATAQCGTLSVPVDWRHPDGPHFGLALARRTATDPGRRLGSLVFGPGGPGDSGVDRVVNGVSRFSDTIRGRYDIVSFDPRGVGASSPVVCSSDLLARQPSPLMTGQADFDATLAYNRELRADCRARTGPVFDHIDTLSAVHDLDAVRAALGERRLTYHGSSYGTLLGEQYAETYPGRVRALALESVVDHSLGTEGFLDTQAAAEQDMFDEFAAWCEAAESCALHGRDVRAVWSGLLARAERGELPDPGDPGTPLDPFALNVLAQKDFYDPDPDWHELADTIAALDAGTRPPGKTAGDTAGRTAGKGPGSAAGAPGGPGAGKAGTTPNPMAVFCQDWSLPEPDYRSYAADLRRVAALAPDMPYPRILLAVTTCLGSPRPVNNPQHPLDVHGSPGLLLLNSLHDPASGYAWATSVAGQLGEEGVLLTYDGAGHGAYTKSPCAREATDAYLTDLVLPARGTHCPAVPVP